MKSLTHPEVNIRMLVLDICEATHLQENVILNTLYERFNDNYINRRNAEPIYLRFDGYRLPHTLATGYISSLALKEGDKEKIDWNHAVDMVLDNYNRQVETSIPFEKFNLLLQDIYLLLPKTILDIEELGLLDKWRYGVDYDESRISNVQVDDKYTRDADTTLGKEYRMRMSEMGAHNERRASEAAGYWRPFIDEGNELVQNGNSKLNAARIVARRHPEENINLGTLRQKLKSNTEI